MVVYFYYFLVYLYLYLLVDHEDISGSRANRLSKNLATYSKDRSSSWVQQRHFVRRYYLRLEITKQNSHIILQLKAVFRILKVRIDLVLLDPDLYWECGSGSRSKEIDQNLQINLIFSLSK
jgi:hypothetical protein